MTNTNQYTVILSVPEMVHRTEDLIPAMEGERLEYTVISSVPELIDQAIICTQIAFLAC